MRLILLPGFGEDPFVFDRIAARIPGSKVVVDHWQHLDPGAKPKWTAALYAQHLVKEYQISGRDILVGHSMGGWIALHVKAIVGCRVIQIASWTHASKVVRLKFNPRLIDWAVSRGLCFNRLTKRVLLIGRDRTTADTQLLATILDRLCSVPPAQVNHQLRIIFSGPPETRGIYPDLRIHARADTIIRFPDEDFLEVQGDHLSLWTHPEEVAAAIVDFLGPPSEEESNGKRSRESNAATPAMTP